MENFSTYDFLRFYFPLIVILTWVLEKMKNMHPIDFAIFEGDEKQNISHGPRQAQEKNQIILHSINFFVFIIQSTLL